MATKKVSATTMLLALGACSEHAEMYSRLGRARIKRKLRSLGPCDRSDAADWINEQEFGFRAPSFTYFMPKEEMKRADALIEPIWKWWVDTHFDLLWDAVTKRYNEENQS